MKIFKETFINDCRKADRKAQRQLFEGLYAPLFRVCMRYINREADAEDCLMKGFMKVFQNLQRFNYENEYSLFVWAKKIMINVVEGYEHKEIAKMLGINESTSRTQLAKARHRLKIMLEQKTKEYEKQG